MQWGKLRQTETPAPFYEGNFISDQSKRANVLRDSLLARHQAAHNLPSCPPLGQARIPLIADLSENEVPARTIGSGNTCSGVDRISVALLDACWDSIRTHITNIFRGCIDLRYHTTCFKLAEVIFLPRAGWDPTLVERWRPIFLLSCLGKGLERLIAKIMSHLAMVSNVVGKQQFGTLPKRSAADLVSCLVHDIVRKSSV